MARRGPSLAVVSEQWWVASPGALTPLAYFPYRKLPLEALPGPFWAAALAGSGELCPPIFNR